MAIEQKLPERKHAESTLAALSAHCGISPEALQDIIALGQRCRLRSLLLFGSRARGTHRADSDIDLACAGGAAARFAVDIAEDLSWGWGIDIVRLDDPLSGELRSEIARDAIQLLPAAAELPAVGSPNRTDVSAAGRNRLAGVNKRKLENYKANLDILEQSGTVLRQSALDPSTLEFVLSGIAGKFAVQFELGWKVLRELLLCSRRVPPEQLRSPRSVILKAASAYHFVNEEMWLRMLADRNSISHRYSGASLADLVQRTVSTYVPEFRRVQLGVEQIAAPCPDNNPPGHSDQP